MILLRTMPTLPLPVRPLAITPREPWSAPLTLSIPSKIVATPRLGHTFAPPICRKASSSSPLSPQTTPFNRRIRHQRR